MSGLCQWSAPTTSIFIMLLCMLYIHAPNVVSIVLDKPSLYFHSGKTRFILIHRIKFHKSIAFK